MTLVLIAGLVVSGYFAYKGASAESAITTYRTAPVERGAVAVMVSGSGQVSASDQVAIKPRVSGDITFVSAQKGQRVEVGALLFTIESSDALRDVRNAETSLETIKLELEELLKPADARTMLQAQNDITEAQEDLEKLKRTQESEERNALAAKQTAEENLEDIYEDAFNDVADVFLDFPDIVTTLHDVLYDYSISKSGAVSYSYWQNIAALRNSIRNTDYAELAKFDVFSGVAETSYTDARLLYEANFDQYKNTSRYSSHESIAALLGEATETARSISEAVKDATNMYDYWSDYRSQRNFEVFDEAVALRAMLSSLTGTVNSHLSRLLSTQGSIRSNTEAIENATQDLEDMKIDHPLEVISAERRIKTLEDDLVDLGSDPDALDIRAKKIQIQQAEQSLLSARQTLGDHYVRAPFAGIVAEVGVSLGESVSSGTELTTLITEQKIAEISLNEVDISKVRVNQKATIIFDAIDNLSVTGEVVEVATLSTTSQGVVTYDVTIVFDVQDERVRSGMSVSVDIITDRKTDVLTVPNAAIKSQGGSLYVEVMQPEGVIRRQTVETGLAGDVATEILIGVSEGDMVITQTIAPAVGSSAAPATNSILPTGGERGFGGGGAFIRP